MKRCFIGAQTFTKYMNGIHCILFMFVVGFESSRFGIFQRKKWIFSLAKHWIWNCIMNDKNDFSVAIKDPLNVIDSWIFKMNYSKAIKQFALFINFFSFYAKEKCIFVIQNHSEHFYCAALFMLTSNENCLFSFRIHRHQKSVRFDTIRKCFRSANIFFIIFNFWTKQRQESWKVNQNPNNSAEFYAPKIRFNFRQIATQRSKQLHVVLDEYAEIPAKMPPRQARETRKGYKANADRINFTKSFIC